MVGRPDRLKATRATSAIPIRMPMYRLIRINSFVGKSQKTQNAFCRTLPEAPSDDTGTQAASHYES